jgi:tetratricopeptide (TPR) repeat protein
MISVEVPDTAQGRNIRLVLTGLTVALFVGGLSWCTWQVLNQAPSFANAIELADAGRLDEAAAKVRAYLAKDPDHAAANLLLAQIVLKQPEPPFTSSGHGSSQSAHEALEHLRLVRPSNPKMAATMQLCRGNALDKLFRLDEAEAAWLQALEVDPTAPEAGWNLLNLYYLQIRDEEARRLVMRLYRVEPDAHDRVMLLLALVKADARPPAPASLVKLFEPVARDHPGDLHVGLTLGLGWVRAGQVERGIDELRRVVQTHSDRVEAWDGLLTGLDEAGQVDAMEEVLENAPSEVVKSAPLCKHRARIAQGSHWKEAVDLYRRAQAGEPFNRVVEYRLSRALRHVGAEVEAERIELRLRHRDVAIQELRPLYDQATDLRDLGVRTHIELCQKIAAAREQMQFPDEAVAWHSLVLQSDPKNDVSLAALARLGQKEH